METIDQETIEQISNMCSNIQNCFDTIRKSKQGDSAIKINTSGNLLSTGNGFTQEDCDKLIEDNLSSNSVYFENIIKQMEDSIDE